MNDRRENDRNFELIIERIDDLRDNTNQRFTILERKIDEKCLVCPINTVVTEKLSGQWWHIKAMWTTIVGVIMVFGAIAAALWQFFFKHVTGDGG